MLGRDDYLFPIAAAQSQFRAQYYGMNAAALLEDVFVDAIEDFRRRWRRGSNFVRAPLGERAYDYDLLDVRVAHKVGLRVQPTSVLWDATHTPGKWSAEHVHAYHLTDHSPIARAVTATAAPETAYTARAVHLDYPTVALRNGRGIGAIVHWPASSPTATILERFSIPTDASDLADSLTWDSLWDRVSQAMEEGLPANEIDVLAVEVPKNKPEPNWLAGHTLTIDGSLRSGVYLIDPDLLVDIDLESNNRAQLIPKATLTDALIAASARELFVPVPTWIGTFVVSIPPSLYAVQRTTYQETLNRS